MIGVNAGDPEPLGWDVCSIESCRGAVVGGTDECIVHCDEEIRENLVVQAFASHAAPLNAQGVRVSARFIDDVTNRAGSTSWALGDEPLTPPAGYLPAVDFGGAVIEADVSFERVMFISAVSFKDATIVRGRFRSAIFTNGAAFSGARFVEPVSFASAHFAGGLDNRFGFFNQAATFARATFGDEATFYGARLGNRASFADARFEQGASFRGAKFGIAARFVRARLGLNSSFTGAAFGDAPRFDRAELDGADFEGASFDGRASFAGVQFGRGASFRDCVFGERPRFLSAQFGERCVIGPCAAAESFDLRDAVVGAGTKLHVTTEALLCNGLMVPDGAELRASARYIALDGSRFVGPTTLSGETYEDTLPAIESLYDVDVAGLAVNNIDLRNCRFGGAHNLDRLRYEGAVRFPAAPRSLRLGWALPPIWRWTRRRVVAEEGAWRASTRKGEGWEPVEERASAREAERGSPPAETATTVQNLMGIRDRLEQKYRIEVDNAALEAAAALAGRHFPEREGVDAALDLLEASLEDASLEQLEARVGKDERAPGLMKEIEEAQRAKEAAIDQREFEQAAAWRDREKQLTDELRQHAAARVRLLEELPSKRTHESDVLGPNNVEAIASKWTGLRVEGLMSDNIVTDPEPIKTPSPGAIAEVYRSLRKGREDQKDAPGAADFYYGEMEMRRNAAPTWSVERQILFIYWLTSGYALRASRALAALAIVVMAVALLLQSGGFKYHPGIGNAVLYSVESSIPGLRPRHEFALTHAAEAMASALHLIGPALIGLAVLSLRGRVRR